MKSKGFKYCSKIFYFWCIWIFALWPHLWRTSTLFNQCVWLRPSVFCSRMSVGVACAASRMEAWPDGWCWIVGPFIQCRHWLSPPLWGPRASTAWKETFYCLRLRLRHAPSLALNRSFTRSLIFLDVSFCCRTSATLTCQPATCWGRSEPERGQNMANSSPLTSRKGRLCRCRSPSSCCRRFDTCRKNPKFTACIKYANSLSVDLLIVCIYIITVQ